MIEDDHRTVAVLTRAQRVETKWVAATTRGAERNVPRPAPRTQVGTNVPERIATRQRRKRVLAEVEIEQCPAAKKCPIERRQPDAKLALQSIDLVGMNGGRKHAPLSPPVGIEVPDPGRLGWPDGEEWTTTCRPLVEQVSDLGYIVFEAHERLGSISTRSRLLYA